MILRATLLTALLACVSVSATDWGFYLDGYWSDFEDKQAWLEDLNDREAALELEGDDLEYVRGKALWTRKYLFARPVPGEVDSLEDKIIAYEALWIINPAVEDEEFEEAAIDVENWQTIAESALADYENAISDHETGGEY